MSKRLNLTTAVTPAITIAAALALSPALATPALADGTAASKANAGETRLTISGSLTGASDYVWRGVSQSDTDPAVFARVNVGYGGFYAGAGTENVRFAGISQEYDLWGGYVFDLGGAKLDLGAVRYGYVDAPARIDTLEGKVALSGNVGKVGLGAAVYHTGNYFGTHHDATYAEARASYPLLEKVTLSGVIGRQSIAQQADYTTWNLGLSYAVVPHGTIDLRYHDTDTNAFGRLGKGRIVGAFTLSF